MNFNIILLFSYSIYSVSCDIYFHNIRGSNNRLNEADFNRKNAKRLFDSQNNNRGGYNVGSTYYHHGSEIDLEWTMQHSCGGSNNNCQVIIQYMCDQLIRDGTTTNTIDTTDKSELDHNYGRHESLDHYRRCYTRERNKRLFTADQKLKKDSAIYTRQNPGGTRYGFECAEERDHYPYWHSSPWKDAAVLTSDVSRCTYYKEESQNVKNRWECLYTKEQLKKLYDKGTIVPNNKAACETSRPLGYKGNWTLIPNHNIAPPECREVPFTRDNHLGNTVDMTTPRYTFTVPEENSDSCVIRIRYNISTNDYDSWKADSLLNAERGKQPTKVNIGAMYNLSSAEASQRGYTFNGNPHVQIFKDAKFKLELAINTAQYGRTFQDRSHALGFKPRPSYTSNTKIHNVNVRGKRGNIVQVYPAVEYDFVPNTLEMSTSDHVHFQWTGSDTNPKNAAGNGRAQTDRSNIVLLTPSNYKETNKIESGLDEKHGYYGNNYPEHLNRSTFLGLERDDLESLAYLSNMQYGGLMSQLDDASPYFNLPPKVPKKSGSFYYMSTRNNDFTNRDQKAVIHVYPYPVSSQLIGSMGGHLLLSDNAEIVAEEGALCGLHKFRLHEWPRSEGDAMAEKRGRGITFGKDYASDYIVIYPITEYCLNPNKRINVTVKLDDGAEDISVYRTDPETFAAWSKVDSTQNEGKALFQIKQGGAYIVRQNHPRSIGLIVGVTIAVIVVLVVVATILYYRKHPNKKFMLLNKVRNYKRGAQDKV